MLSLSEWVVRQRYVLLTAALVAVCWSAYLATTLKIYDDPNRWPPESDPAVVLNEELQRKFGGANMVTIMMAGRIKYGSRTDRSCTHNTQGAPRNSTLEPNT